MTDLIVDANSLFQRSWWASAAARGFVPSMALESALRATVMLFDRKRTGESIDRTLFAWDGAHKTEKNRKPKPPAMLASREEYKAAVKFMFGTINVLLPDCEADDVIATAACDSTADQVIVATGDKDLYQLHGRRTAIYDFKAKAILNPRSINAKWGIKKPSQIPIALAVIGDSVDGIKGIPGWGAKRVEQLFEKVTPEMNFETALDVIYQQIPEKLRGNFEEAFEKTLLIRDLKHVPEPVELVLASVDKVDELGMSPVTETYCRVFGMHRNVERRVESVLDRVIKRSKSGEPHRPRD